MKFEFTTTSTPNTTVWQESNARLEQNLKELVNGTASVDVVRAYCLDMFKALRTVNNENCKGMLFLMYAEPASMPADARVEFVYRPTYLAATIVMTAMNRFESLAKDDTFRSKLKAILEATTARGFRGAGYNEYVGFIDVLEIFATGDTVEFTRKYPDINEHFVSAFNDAIEFLEKDICSGKIRDMWSGETYTDRAEKVLAMYKKEKTADTEYVWYACYGSNINNSRFMEYINSCTDKTPPLESRPYQFEHPIYFAKSSKRWDNGGVAFLNDTCEGEALGRMYKITKEQYEQIKRKEGPNYGKKIYLGETDGIPMYTFTDFQKNEPLGIPSVYYFLTILNGLRDVYNGIYSDEALVVYLIDNIFPENLFHVARAIKESDHYISNQQICEIIGSDITTVTDSTEWLVAHKVIQQDRRSINAGHNISDSEAFFFTVDSPCGRGLLNAMVDIISGFEKESAEENFEGETEGHRHYVLSSRIERSARNRIEAIKLHGYKCQVCGFDFESTYGELGRNYIEVHHVNPLAEQDGEHVVNPETDLVCLCANCHRMIHRNRNEVLSVDELRNNINC